jgi:hypothetical protein
MYMLFIVPVYYNCYISLDCLYNSIGMESSFLRDKVSLDGLIGMFKKVIIYDV